jgi:hypothetical protein
MPPQLIQKKILIPLPDKDFDPTQVAVVWKLLKLEGSTAFEVIFATEKGRCNKKT